MARGIFLGKSRTPQSTKVISNPVLKYSDALPRTDLRDIESVANNRRPANQAVEWDFQRPRTADGRKQKKKGPGASSNFDFQIARSPAEAVTLPKIPDDDPNVNLIGVALGSPRMVEPQSMLSRMQEQPPVPTTTNLEQTSQLKRKPSKWRKIGGLFKAKNAMASSANQPFYRVRCGEERPLHESTHSIDYQNQPGTEYTSSPPSNAEVWPCLKPENDSTGINKGQPAIVVQPSTQNNEMIPESKHRSAGPLLQVDIPDVQLERYSVMFGRLLNKNEPSLLNRRSQTLDDISIPTQGETSLSSPDLHLPRRRATSPRPRLPSFNLFPVQAPASKASKVLGSRNIPRGPSLLNQSQISLSRSGSETPTNEQSHFLLMVHSSSLKSPMSHQTKNSVSSILSSVSIDSTEEKRLLEKLKQTKTHIHTEKEPEWEIINKKPTKETATNQSPSPSPSSTSSWSSNSKQKARLALTINTQDLPTEPTLTDSASSSPLLSPLNSATGQTRSPGAQFAISPASTTRMPLSDETEDPDALEPMDPIPRIEVSIARSVSVSRGKKQVLVPIGPRSDRLSPDERLVMRRAKTPQVRDVHYGHRHGNSQDARIETI